jgi:DNA invertase Pin-like site-specific DNA recombinase
LVAQKVPDQKYFSRFTRLDRLARSTRDLLNVLAAIAQRGAGFQSLADACTGGSC